MDTDTQRVGVTSPHRVREGVLKAVRMEKIEIARRHPYWKHAMDIVIAPSKFESLADEMGDAAPI